MSKEARELKDYYLTKEFEDKYNYEGSLGAKVDERGTVIRLWSPIAESVDLRLYDNGSTGEAETIIPMKLCDKGVWEYSVNENLSGKYYENFHRPLCESLWSKWKEKYDNRPEHY